MEAKEIDRLLNLSIEEVDDETRRVTKKLDYYNRGIFGMSYSRSTQLHGCPRRYELATKFKLRPRLENIDFAYGHAVGVGIQSTLQLKSFPRVMLDTMLEYDMDITRSEQDIKGLKSGKTYWNALLIVQRFYEFYHGKALSYLEGWEVAKFTHPETGEEIDGVELTFVIDCGEAEVQGETYRKTYEGHIDLVLYHPIKKRYMVLELKTSGGTRVDDASYCNSAQALGYGCVLDAIAGNLKQSASFDVLYLIAKSKTDEFVPMVFTKTYKDKAQFLMNMLMDFDSIDRYESLQHFPTHGENCNAFFRPCEYLKLCHLPNSELENRQVKESADSVIYSVLEKPTFMFSIEDMFAIQDKLVALSEDSVAHNGEIDMLLDVTNVNY